MKFCLSLKFELPKGLSPAQGVKNLTEQAKAAKDAGFYMVQCGERHATTFPVVSNFTILTHLSSFLGEMKLAPLLVIPYYEPVLLAEYVANLDVITNGRVIPIFTVGEWENDFKAFRIPVKQRVSRFEEGLRIMKLLWSNDHISFKGKRFVLDDVSINPKPVQQPMPFWIGGDSSAAMERAIVMGATAWLISPMKNLSKAESMLNDYRASLDNHGRNDVVEYPIRQNIHLATNKERALKEAEPFVKKGHMGMTFDPDQLIIGDAQTCIDRIKALEKLGVTSVQLRQLVDDHKQVIEWIRIIKNKVIPKL